VSDNSRKTWLASTLPAAARTTINAALEQNGLALPCHVVSVSLPFVTIAFDIQTQDTLPQVTVPILMSRYVRLPIQINDTGLCVPADAYLGPITGMGGSTATLLQPANLGALAFLPIAKKTWTPVDPNAVVISAPNGAVIESDDSTAKITVTPGHIAMTADTQISLTVGGHTIVISSSGTVIDGKTFLTHTHTGVTIGSGTSGPVA
jgi:hypothetical protein